MFSEYKEHDGIDVPTLGKILKASRGADWAAAVFETPDLETSVAVVELDLILAFQFLVNSLADAGVAMDAYLAELLEELDPSFKKQVMGQFVKFRSLNGICLDEDKEFQKSGDVSLYVIEKKCPGCGQVGLKSPHGCT